MSYLHKIEYRILPKEIFRIIRNCPGCGGKSVYCSTGNFRVNANGNQLDVWLIYHCPKCKHTFNLSIYERKRVSDISAEEYRAFLTNDVDTVFHYGLDKSIFIKNRAEIAWDDITYDILPVNKETYEKNEYPKYGMILQNPYGLKLRTEKVIADILQITRSKTRKWIKEGICEAPQKYIGATATIIFHKTEISDR